MSSLFAGLFVVSALAVRGFSIATGVMFILWLLGLAGVVAAIPFSWTLISAGGVVASLFIALFSVHMADIIQ